MRQQRAVGSVLTLTAAMIPGWGCASARPGISGEKPVSETVEPADLSWFIDSRFGLFIHWGPVSQVGTEIGWSRGSSKRPGIIPIALYDNLYRYFNPTAFDADAFVAAARSAGMKYLVFTTKHHDGFCMFDSEWTDYKITRTPFRRDITAEIADACHRGGLKLGFYYSPPDWHHPDYRTENHARYIAYMHRQLRELCTNYGRVDLIWFDGLDMKPEEMDAPRLLEMIRRLQPGVVINNRSGLAADYDTPEQRVGAWQGERPWETCMTIGQQWSFKNNDQVKPAEQLIQTLLQCADGNGNFLLNVGPKWTGQIEPDQLGRLKEIGDWLSRYGESVYGTRGGPIFAYPWGGSTHRGQRIYLHVWDWPTPRLPLPALGREIRQCVVLTGGNARVVSDGTRTFVELPDPPRPAVTVIALDLDGPADTISPLGPVTFRKTVTASNVFENKATVSPDKAIDGSRGTRWATDTLTRSAWIEVDLGGPSTFDAAVICEESSRVEAFELQALRDGEWRTFHQGAAIGPRLLAAFDPVTAQRVRLRITRASEGPAISEFQLFADCR